MQARALHIFPKICEQAQNSRRQNGFNEGSSKRRTTNAIRQRAIFGRMSEPYTRDLCTNDDDDDDCVEVHVWESTLYIEFYVQ